MAVQKAETMKSRLYVHFLTNVKLAFLNIGKIIIV